MEEAEDEARAAAIGEALKKFDEQSKDIMRSLPPEKVYNMKGTKNPAVLRGNEAGFSGWRAKQ